MGLWGHEFGELRSNNSIKILAPSSKSAIVKAPKAPKAPKALKKEKMSSVKLQQKAAGYMLAAANATKQGR